MAFYGHHKRTKIRYHVGAWVLTFYEELPICNVCNNELKIKANSTVSNTATHFYHANNTFCPTIANNRKRYEGLKPTVRDEENAKRIRELTSEHLDKVYLKCKFLSDNKLSYSEFKAMLITANENDIWYYKGLTFKHIPYVLLVNHGVFTDKKMYFVFESNLTSYDELWNKQKTIRNKIWRVNMITEDIEEFTMYDDLIVQEYFFRYRDCLEL